MGTPEKLSRSVRKQPPRLSNRGLRLAVITALLLLILAFYNLRTPMMGDSEIPLKVTLTSVTPTLTTDSPPQVDIHIAYTITNTSPHPLAFVNWGTPLDPSAPRTGVFSFHDLSSRKEVPGLGMMINRKVPQNGIFAKELVAKFEAGGVYKGEAVVKEREMKLERGKRYEVQAKGRWFWVWEGKEVESGVLSAESKDVKSGEFGSEGVGFVVDV